MYAKIDHFWILLPSEYASLIGKTQDFIMHVCFHVDPLSLFLCVRTFLMVPSSESDCEPQREWSYPAERYIECVCL